MKEFQEHIKRLYYEKDKQRPLAKNILKLIEEIGELAESLLIQNPKTMEEEFADVLAWIASLANLYNIDLEKAVYKKYPKSGCPYCHSIPCICDSF